MTAAASPAVADLCPRRAQFLEATRTLVECESPSDDVRAVAECAEAVAAVGERLLGVAPRRISAPDGRTHLRWRGSGGSIAVVGHLDTVWPKGTLAVRPWDVAGDIVRAPGVLDAKAGLVLALMAIAEAGAQDHVDLLITADEEIGAPTSRATLGAIASVVSYALVVEPAAGHAVKTARRGRAAYRIRVDGRSAHAGLEPERGVNATIEVARLVTWVHALSAPTAGVTVIPTTLRSGTSANVVPAWAALDVDVRADRADDLTRINALITGVTAHTPGASVRVEGGIDAPPFESAMSAGLFERAAAAAGRLGLPRLQGAHVGGTSDGNLLAGAGIPTLDGLGAVGGGAHADDEHIVVPATLNRLDLLRELIRDLVSSGDSA